ncbi:MAG TPA: Ig-like domain-containing protein, partial [Pirellulales bacterium]|nr:Ig-like domain-containing protein [Pirellulales bacterium]
MATAADPTITGRVTDNLSGTKSLTVAIDGGAATAVALDAAGNFQVPMTLAIDGTADGVHTLAFSATDFAGNASPVTSFNFTLDTKAPVIALTAPLAGGALTAGAALTGTVNPTGSALVALSYMIDGGTAMPLAFDPLSGVFDQALDLSKLSAGNHSLVVTATDAAGNASQQTLGFSLASAIPLSLTNFTPQIGSGDVGVTYRPQVFFSRAIDTSTLTAADFYATDTTGAVVPATIVPAGDGTFAWLFFTNPMPGASTITVTVDGTQIKAADGSFLDAAN